MWRVAKQTRIVLGFLCDSLHDFDELVEGLAALSFGRLDHEGFLDNEREVHGWWVYPIVDQSLGHIESSNAVSFFQVPR